MSTRVRITDVGPRDGLQNEPGVISVADKIDLVDRLATAGLMEIEVSGFVSPKWVPQLADAGEVFKGINRRQDVMYSALVPNEQGHGPRLDCWGQQGVGMPAAVACSITGLNLSNEPAKSVLILRRQKVSLAAVKTDTLLTPAVKARAMPCSLGTSAEYITSWRRLMPLNTSPASANCGTHLGLTNPLTSISIRPAVASRSTRSILSATDITPGSFWRPSRGPTSVILTLVLMVRRGLVVHGAALE